MHSRVLTRKTSGLASHAKPPAPPPPCHAPVTAPASCRALPALPPTHEPSPRIALTPHGHKGGRPLTPPTNVRNVRNGSTRDLSMEALWWAPARARLMMAAHHSAAHHSAPHDGRLHTSRDALTAHADGNLPALLRSIVCCRAHLASRRARPVLPVRTGGGECFGLLWHKR